MEENENEGKRRKIMHQLLVGQESRIKEIKGLVSCESIVSEVA